MDDKVIELIEKKCNSFDFSTHVTVNEIFIKSKKSNWRVIDNCDGSYDLYHENFSGRRSSHANFETNYHYQKTFSDVVDMVCYIHSHDYVRYTNKEKYCKNYIYNDDKKTS